MAQPLSVAPPAADAAAAFSCNICLESDAREDDVIVACDGCGINVHQSCYALAAVPPGPWFCARCVDVDAAGPELAPRKDLEKIFFETRCVSCNRPGDVMVPLAPRDGRFIHVMCGWFSPGASLWGDDEEGAKAPLPAAQSRRRPEREAQDEGDPTPFLSKLAFGYTPPPPKEGLPNYCCICGGCDGEQVRCRQAKCHTHFHVLCGLGAAYGRAIVRIVPAGADGLGYHAYCPAHRSLAYSLKQIIQKAITMVSHPRYNAEASKRFVAKAETLLEVLPSLESGQVPAGPGETIEEMCDTLLALLPSKIFQGPRSFVKDRFWYLVNALSRWDPPPAEEEDDDDVDDDGDDEDEDDAVADDDNDGDVGEAEGAAEEKGGDEETDLEKEDNAEAEAEDEGEEAFGEDRNGDDGKPTTAPGGKRARPAETTKEGPVPKRRRRASSSAVPAPSGPDAADEDAGEDAGSAGAEKAGAKSKAKGRRATPKAKAAAKPPPKAGAKAKGKATAKAAPKSKGRAAQRAAAAAAAAAEAALKKKRKAEEARARSKAAAKKRAAEAAAAAALEAERQAKAEEDARLAAAEETRRKKAAYNAAMRAQRAVEAVKRDAQRLESRLKERKRRSLVDGLGPAAIEASKVDLRNIPGAAGVGSPTLVTLFRWQEGYDDRPSPYEPASMDAEPVFLDADGRPQPPDALSEAVAQSAALAGEAASEDSAAPLGRRRAPRQAPRILSQGQRCWRVWWKVPPKEGVSAAAAIAVAREVATTLLSLNDSAGSGNGMLPGVIAETLGGLPNPLLKEMNDTEVANWHDTVAPDARAVADVEGGQPCWGCEVCGLEIVRCLSRGRWQTSINGEQLLNCSICGVGVHQCCYGAPGGLAETGAHWLCMRCYNGYPAAATPCGLCLRTGGAMQPMDAPGRFAHVLCAWWDPDVAIPEVAHMRPLLLTRSPTEARRRLVCGICRRPGGLCLQCDNVHCNVGMHALCALERGVLELRIDLGILVRDIKCPRCRDMPIWHPACDAAEACATEADLWARECSSLDQPTAPSNEDETKNDEPPSNASQVRGVMDDLVEAVVSQRPVPAEPLLYRDHRQLIAEVVRSLVSWEDEVPLAPREALGALVTKVAMLPYTKLESPEAFARRLTALFQAYTAEAGNEAPPGLQRTLLRHEKDAHRCVEHLRAWSVFNLLAYLEQSDVF